MLYRASGDEPARRVARVSRPSDRVSRNLRIVCRRHFIARFCRTAAWPLCHLRQSVRLLRGRGHAVHISRRDAVFRYSRSSCARGFHDSPPLRRRRHRRPALPAICCDLRGLSNLPGRVLVKRDLSYGVYLIHAPVLASLIILYPGVGPWWVVAGVVALVTLTLSYLSWTLVEGPALAKEDRCAMGRRSTSPNRNPDLATDRRQRFEESWRRDSRFGSVCKVDTQLPMAETRSPPDRPAVRIRSIGEGRTMTRMALITPSFAPDFELCVDLHRSVLDNAPDYARHHIIVPREDLELFGRLAGPRTHIHCEADFLPRSFVSVPFSKFTVNLRRPFPPVRGWILQQVVKLAAVAASEDDVVVVVDSDIEFVRPFTAETFVNDGRVRFYRKPGGVDERLPRHVIWHRVARSLLGLPPAEPPYPDYIASLLAWDPTDRAANACSGDGRDRAPVGHSDRRTTSLFRVDALRRVRRQRPRRAGQFLRLRRPAMSCPLGHDTADPRDCGRILLQPQAHRHRRHDFCEIPHPARGQARGFRSTPSDAALGRSPAIENRMTGVRQSISASWTTRRVFGVDLEWTRAGRYGYFAPTDRRDKETEFLASVRVPDSARSAVGNFARTAPAVALPFRAAGNGAALLGHVDHWQGRAYKTCGYCTAFVCALVSTQP